MVTNEELLKRIVKYKNNDNLREIKKLKLFQMAFKHMDMIRTTVKLSNSNVAKMAEISELSKECIDNMFKTVKVLEADSKVTAKRTKHLEEELDKAFSTISKLSIENNRLKLNRFIYKLEGMIAGAVIVSIVYLMIVR